MMSAAAHEPRSSLLCRPFHLMQSVQMVSYAPASQPALCKSCHHAALHQAQSDMCIEFDNSVNAHVHGLQPRFLYDDSMVDLRLL